MYLLFAVSDHDEFFTQDDENGLSVKVKEPVWYFVGIFTLTLGRMIFDMRQLLKRLLQIEDTPERTALAFSIGIFLGFSPFLGLHTLSGLAVAFLFKLNRVAILLGVWSNTPWWIVPYYTVATWLGMWVIRFQMNWATLTEIFQFGKGKGFLTSEFWMRITSQWGLLLSFLFGSLILALLFSLMAYPLSLRAIKFYRSQKAKGREQRA